MQVDGLQATITGLCPELVRAGSKLHPLRILHELGMHDHPLRPLVHLGELLGVLEEVGDSLNTEEKQLHSLVTSSLSQWSMEKQELDGMMLDTLPMLTPRTVHALMEDVSGVGVDLDQLLSDEPAHLFPKAELSVQVCAW